MKQNEKIAEVLADAGHTLRKVASERDTLAEENQQLKRKLAGVERRLFCEKVAADMHSKNLRTDVEFADLVDELEKSADDGRLPAIVEAVKMAAPDMGTHFTINNDEASGGPGMSDLEAFLIGEVR